MFQYNCMLGWREGTGEIMFCPWEAWGQGVDTVVWNMGVHIRGILVIHRHEMRQSNQPDCCLRYSYDQVPKPM